MDAALGSFLVPACAWAAGARVWPALAFTSWRASSLSGILAAAALASVVRESVMHLETESDFAVAIGIIGVFELLWHLTQSWSVLPLPWCERVVMIQAMAAALFAWLHHAVIGVHLRESWDVDAALRLVLTTLLGGTALLVLVTAPLLRRLGRRNSRCVPEADSATADSADDDTSTHSDARTSSVASIQQSCVAYGVLACVVCGLQYPLLAYCLREEPFTWVTRYVFSSHLRGGLVAFWAACVVLLIAVVPSPPARQPAAPATDSGSGSGSGSAQTTGRPRHLHPWHANLILRKAFHVAACVMFIPPILLGGDAQAMLALAFTVALQALVLAELIRALHLQPALLSNTLHRYMTGYTDTRDAGVLVRTHIYLLLGCALPVVVDVVAGYPSPSLSSGAAAGTALLAPLSGILAVGVGDAVAAVVGVKAHARGTAVSWRTVADRIERAMPWYEPEEEQEGDYRRHSFTGANKTVQGTVAFILSSFAVLFVCHAVVWSGSGIAGSPSALHWAVAAALLTVTALVETFIECVDNLVLPLVVWVGAHAAAYFLHV